MPLSKSHVAAFTCLFVWVALLFMVPGNPAWARTSDPSSSVAVYPRPPIYPASPEYSVSVKDASGNSSAASTFDFTSGCHKYAFSQFSFSGSVQVTVTTKAAFTSATISPTKLNIVGTSGKNSLTFNLSESHYLILKFDSMPELVIAADPAESNVPVPGASGVTDIMNYNAAPDASPYPTLATMAADAKKNTEAINTAIIAAHNAAKKQNDQQQVVFVPAGVYYINKIVLHSHVNLYLQGGAVLRSSDDTANMTTDFGSDADDLPAKGTWLVSTDADTQDISITGRGMIDGDGYTMRYSPGLSGGNVIDTLIMPLRTRNFTVDGIVGWNAGFWGLTPALAKEVKISNYKALNMFGKQEDDGIDINESQNVSVTHAIAVSQDDNYSTKTWCAPSVYGDKPNLVQNWGSHTLALANVVFSDVTAWSADDAFKVGYGICQDQSEVMFENGYVYQALHAVDITVKDYDSQDASAGTTSGITFQNLDIEQILPFSDGTYQWAKIGEAPDSTNDAFIKDLTYADISVHKNLGPQSFAVPAKSPHAIDTLTFKGINYSGTSVTDANELKFNTNPNALTNVTVSP